jgi:PAS domain-containing protein
MQSRDLEVFNNVPFFFWVKDGDGRFMWANRALIERAKVDLVGRTDHELPWAESADAFRTADKEVMETGKTRFLREDAEKLSKTTLYVCKWVGELDGKKGVFGVSFAVD